MSLTEQQARRTLKQLVGDFYQRLSAGELESATESDILGYIERLFRDVLGWPIDDVTRFQREKSLPNRKRPDRILTLDDGDKIFVEAKRLGFIEQLSEDWTVRPGQMSLPGMAADRTKEEQQAINYAFQSNGTWAILTNFERFRLFNARRDWLVFSFEAAMAYEKDFDLLWQLSWENMNRGSLEALSGQRWTKEVDTDYLSFINFQREQLATDIILNRDENPWVFLDDGRIDLELLREVVQRFLDRLILVRFAEDHFVIAPRTLATFYELRTKVSNYTNELRVYLNEFFRHFDREHNSALFAFGEVDEAKFSDEVLLPLIEKLYEARFRAMPADVMGNTYEQYLGKVLVEDNGFVAIRDNLEKRKKQGTYYTPQHIVRFIVDQTLGRLLYATHNGRPNGIAIIGMSRKTSEEIRDLRVLDSACGSGSFLIYAYEVLAEYYQLEIQRLSDEHTSTIKEISRNLIDVSQEIHVKAQRIEDERDFIRDNYRDLILENHLYGADLDPQAAEIAAVNLIMRAMEGRGIKKRLPLILNQNVKVGNSLHGISPDSLLWDEFTESLSQIARLRRQIRECSHLSKRHDQLVAELKLAVGNLHESLSHRQPKYYSDEFGATPFHWTIEFPEVFIDERGEFLDNPGFDIIVGNPPYGAALTDRERKHYNREYHVGTTNSAALFMSRSLQLLAQNAVHGFIVPKSFLYSSTWNNMRESMLDGLEILVDCGKAWPDVKLEQVIYLHRKASCTHSYSYFEREKNVINYVGITEKRECRRFGFLINFVLDEADLRIADKLTKSQVYLGNHISNSRGVVKKDELSSLDSGYSVVGGRNIQRYTLQERKGQYTSENVPDKAKVKVGNVLVQNIVAHIQWPVPHIRIAAHAVQDGERNILLDETVNQLEVSSEYIQSNFLVGLLNSKLMNWYAYRFIFAKAIRTMHFDGPTTDRIPLPDLESQGALFHELVSEVINVYSGPPSNQLHSRNRIDSLIYQLYDLSPKDIANVERNMP